MNRNYLTISIEDYLMLGRVDAWNENRNKEYEINRMINCLSNNSNVKENFKKIRNYILGYKIGKLELLFSKCEDKVAFSFALHRFMKATDNQVKTILFEDGYKTFKEEATEEAGKLLLKIS